MTRIVLDHSVLTQLSQANGPVEVFDPQGKMYGVFQPSMNLADLEPAISEVELRRRAADPAQGRKLWEILKDLEGRS